MSKNATSIGDRFLPERSAINFDISHYNLMKENDACSSASEKYATSLSEALYPESSQTLGAKSCKILAYKHKAPAPSETYQNQMKTLYSSNKKSDSTSRVTSVRKISSTPEKVLDAPGIRDDYYLNLLDWSSQNTLAVALDKVVYLWDATNSEITELMELPEEGDYITSVSWMADGNVIAVGTSAADVQLWDVARSKKVRTMKGHSGRVSSLAWNRCVLSSGSSDTTIMHNDVRLAQHHVATLQSHTQEVCGLKWSEDGSQLASGGNDNILCLWDEGRDQPRFRLDHHQAAVKALAWCPWQAGLLASGGGSSDRCIKMWNTKTGACLSSVDTGSQVCSLQWAKEYRELISSHGYSENQLCVWKYPSMVKLAELHGHTSRVLFTAVSPDGQTVVSAAGDERLRFWNVWPSRSRTASSAKKESAEVASTSGLRSYTSYIR